MRGKGERSGLGEGDGLRGKGERSGLGVGDGLRKGGVGLWCELLLLQVKCIGQLCEGYLQSLESCQRLSPDGMPCSHVTHWLVYCKANELLHYHSKPLCAILYMCITD